MGRDVRTFQVSLSDNALVWRVLETIESVAKEDAARRDLEVETEVDVDHATGEYTRETVAEAEETSQRSGFTPGRIGLQLALVNTDAQPGGTWIRASRYRRGEPLTVQISLGTTSEVDRVRTMLRESVTAVPGSAPAGDPPGQPAWDGRDTRTFQFAVPDDATLWRALEAIETAAADDASGRGLEIDAEIEIEHPSGEYTRDSVAEAKMTSQRNDFAPEKVRLRLSRLRNAGQFGDTWLRVTRYGESDPLKVAVTEDGASEVDRVLAVLEESVSAVPGLSLAARRGGQIGRTTRDTRTFQLPVPDDATLWRVLQTVEATAGDEATAREQALVAELRIGNASGEYTRSTVAAAKEALARNDIAPTSVHFRLAFKPPDAPSWWSLSDEGISVRRFEGDRPLTVEIAMAEEDELNRIFTRLQETFEDELRATPKGALSLGSSDQDTRKFLVETAEDALLWRALEAVASAAEDAARHADRTVAATLSIGHSTGEYVRSTVAEAKATSQKNGFAPESVRFELFRIGPDADLTLRHLDPWLRVSRHKPDVPLEIEILSGNEIEVSGVFNKLQDHVKAAIQSTQGGTNNAVLVPPTSSAPPQSRLKRILNHGWTVEVVGGLTAAVGGGLIIAWIVSR